MAGLDCKTVIIDEELSPSQQVGGEGGRKGGREGLFYYTEES